MCELLSSLLSFVHNVLSAPGRVTYEVPEGTPKTPPPPKIHSSLIPDVL